VRRAPGLARGSDGVPVVPHPYRSRIAAACEIPRFRCATEEARGLLGGVPIGPVDEFEPFTLIRRRHFAIENARLARKNCVDCVMASLKASSSTPDWSLKVAIAVAMINSSWRPFSPVPLRSSARR
jgi:hypothetical protein